MHSLARSSLAVSKQNTLLTPSTEELDQFTSGESGLKVGKLRKISRSHLHTYVEPASAAQHTQQHPRGTARAPSAAATVVKIPDRSSPQTDVASSMGPQLANRRDLDLRAPSHLLGAANQVWGTSAEQQPPSARREQGRCC